MLSILLMAVTLLACTVFAAAEGPQAMQPRGAFLWTGDCSMTPMTGQVKVKGSTECYSAVDDVSVTLELYAGAGSGIWTRVWADTYSAQNSSAVYSPTVYVTCDPGRYYLKATHTA